MVAMRWTLFLVGFCVCGTSGDFLDVPEFDYINDKINPCDDFYEYTCGKFEDIHPLPAEEPTWGHFSILQNEIHDVIRIILNSEYDEGEPEALQKAKLAYRSCVNTEQIDHSIFLPEKKIIEELGGWPAILSDTKQAKPFKWSDYADIISDYGIHFFFTYYTIPNPLNASENVIYFTDDSLANSSLINPLAGKDTTTIIPMIQRERDYLDVVRLDTFARTLDEDAPFVAFIRKLALRLRDELNTGKSDEDVYKDLDDVLDFMRKLLTGGIKDSDAIVANLSTVVTVSGLQNWTDVHFDPEELQLDWLDYFNHIFKWTGIEITPDMKVIPKGTEQLYGILNLLKSTKKEVLKNFAIVRVLTYSAGDSDEFMRDALNGYYEKENFSLYSRDEYCLRKILDYPNDVGFSFALTHQYQLYHFNVNNLEGAAQMIEHLESTFQNTVNNSDWIDDATKQKALAKAANMVTLLAYPEFVETSESIDKFYENVEICAWDNPGNSKRIRSFRLANNLVEIGNERNRRVWNTSPLTTNAFYNRANNRMLFPVAMLNPIFYRGESILDYGRIGAIIGHEITHGFDGDGMKYDKDGTLVGTWWSTETLQNFNERINCFVDHYNQYYIEELQTYVNGSKTLNENLADNGGVRIAYKALKNLNVEAPNNRFNYTNDQLFFVAFGTMWCSGNTDEYLATLEASGYPPTKFRVNGVLSNMVEFSEAFNCPVGSNMNPEKKCTLW